MKIGYHLIDSPFKYYTKCLNDNLDYKPPNHKSIAIFGTLVGATSKTLWEIKLTIPINNGGTGPAQFDYTLYVASVFDDIITHNKTCTFTIDQFCATYQN